MTNNPQCLKCGGRTTKGGKMRSGNQRYYCRVCKYYFSPVIVGRIPEGDRTQTGAERQRKYRAKKKAEKDLEND